MRKRSGLSCDRATATREKGRDERVIERVRKRQRVIEKVRDLRVSFQVIQSKCPKRRRIRGKKKGRNDSVLS